MFGVAMVLLCVFKVGVVGVFGVVGVELVLVGLYVNVVVLFTLFVEFDWWFELEVEMLSKRVVSESFLSFSVMSSSVVFR